LGGLNLSGNIAFKVEQGILAEQAVRQLVLIKLAGFPYCLVHAIFNYPGKLNPSTETNIL
jgi:hypothetical protein